MGGDNNKIFTRARARCGVPSDDTSRNGLMKVSWNNTNTVVVCYNTESHISITSLRCQIRQVLYHLVNCIILQPDTALCLPKSTTLSSPASLVINCGGVIRHYRFPLGPVHPWSTLSSFCAVQLCQCNSANSSAIWETACGITLWSFWKHRHTIDVNDNFLNKSRKTF